MESSRSRRPWKRPERRSRTCGPGVNSAQHLAAMGDYDWHIPTDTNSWSDELYRIYGYEPQSFNATYERFLSMIHPDDRERIEGIHQDAYQTGGGYQMMERIVRPDGEVRYLSSNGEVVTAEDGTPVRMRGTCIDITERVLAEREREELAANLREAQVRRRQALEINDNLVQGLTAAVLCIDSGDRAGAAAHLKMVLSAARTMMNNLLVNPDGKPLVPGDLTRSVPSSLAAPEPGPGPKPGRGSESAAKARSGCWWSMTMPRCATCCERSSSQGDSTWSARRATGSRPSRRPRSCAPTWWSLISRCHASTDSRRSPGSPRRCRGPA